jgi:asparagine synthase (glutamine-hydrolysing)
MCVQFGRWNSNGRPLDSTDLARVKPLIAAYGPDDEGAYAISNLHILYRAFHTTKESRIETQPHTTGSGSVVTWCGRLDNRTELIGQLRDVLTTDATDVSIVGAAYGKWGTNCFRRLIGDWALSIWESKSQSLILAKDPIGTRSLYYSVESGQVTWSTILDPLVLLADKTFALCEEYIAGWFSQFPAPQLTPYIGIHSVPPSSSVVIGIAKQITTKYWDFDPGKKIRYRTDAEYEEHFRAVFREAVRRRLRSDSPVLAELSGGMDSSSIVCMADTILASCPTESPRVDTISYFDDSEPDWNERPYFSRVEEKRGRIGLHVCASTDWSLTFDRNENRVAISPGSRRSPPPQVTDWIRSRGHRILLSGIGGDEVNGGVPTPIPELEDLLAEGKVKKLIQQLAIWSLQQRRPWFHLLLEAVARFAPNRWTGSREHHRPGIWLRNDFVRRNRPAFLRYERRLQIIGPAPSFQENIATLDALRRQMASVCLPFEPPFEKCYPYLDRSFLEFMFAVPRDQLVRPGQRRSLMRRALSGIVPEEVLNRSRKAYVSRSPIAAISAQYPRVLEMCGDMVSGSLGFVVPELFRGALEEVRLGRIAPGLSLMRTLGIECWLQSLKSRGVLVGDAAVFSRLPAPERESALTAAP